MSDNEEIKEEGVIEDGSQRVMPENTSTLILAVARDCESIVEIQMEALFEDLKMMGSISFEVLIYENDSSDGTVEAFNNVFEKSPDNVDCRIVSEKLDLEAYDSVVSKDRIDKMALIRNNCLDSVEDMSDYAAIIWLDMDYHMEAQTIPKILAPVLLGDADVLSVYSLHGDVQRPEKELYDKWATRGQKSDTWWNCTPHELLYSLVMQPQVTHLKLYSTFNGICAFNAKGFVDGAVFSSMSLSAEINGIDHDVEWISLCEQFSEMGLDKIFMDVMTPAYHFSSHENMVASYNQRMEVKKVQDEANMNRAEKAQKELNEKAQKAIKDGARSSESE